MLGPLENQQLFRLDGPFPGPAHPTSSLQPDGSHFSNLDMTLRVRSRPSGTSGPTWLTQAELNSLLLKSTVTLVASGQISFFPQLVLLLYFITKEAETGRGRINLDSGHSGC